MQHMKPNCVVLCCDHAAATLLEPLADTLREAAGAELKITVRAKGSEQQQVGRRHSMCWFDSQCSWMSCWGLVQQGSRGCSLCFATTRRYPCCTIVAACSLMSHHGT